MRARDGVILGAAAVAIAAAETWRARRAARSRPAPDAGPRVVIVCAGFAGLNAARALAGQPVRVVVVDRRNHHLFQLLRHQRNTEVILGNVERVDAAARTFHLSDGAVVPYDALVVATGATHTYFGHPEWEPLAPGLKTLEDAREIRRRVLTAYELAEREGDPDVRRALMTFVVVGGGATGVELAGALAEIARYTLARDFRHIAAESARVVLVEASPRVLPTYSERLSGSARSQLERIGVEVRTGATVTGIGDHGVDVGRERISSRTVLCGAGVAASPLARSLGVPLDRSGRIEVLPDLSVPGRPEVFVAGDLARVVQDGELVPGIAAAAIQAGRRAARNALRRLQGRRTRSSSASGTGSPCWSSRPGRTSRSPARRASSPRPPSSAGFEHELRRPPPPEVAAQDAPVRA